MTSTGTETLAEEAGGATGRVSPLLLIALFSGLFLVFLDTTVVNVALPDLQEKLDADVRGLQWVVDAYLLTFSCLLLSAGALADRIGAKRLFVGALVGFTLTSAWCAMSGSVGMLLAARAAQGVTGAVLMPVSMVIITQLYPDPTARGRMVGVQSAVAGLALTAGPLIGGVLVERYGWQSVFWVNIPVGVLAVIVLTALLPHARPEHRNSMDIVGQLLFVAGVGLLTYALIEGNSAKLDLGAHRRLLHAAPPWRWPPSCCGRRGRRTRCCRWASSGTRMSAPGRSSTSVCSGRCSARCSCSCSPCRR